MNKDSFHLKKKVIPVGMHSQTSEYLDPKYKLPFIIKANSKDLDLAHFVNENKSRIDDILNQTGAILFSDFAVDSIERFHNAVLAFGNEMLDYEFGSTPRTKVEKKIYTSTEYPADQFIPMHNEMSYTDQWPGKIWFFCEQPALKGGETPIADSREVYARIPLHIQKLFGQSGIRYVRNYWDAVDVPWQQVFNTSEREKVEEYCRSRKINFEWKEGHLQTWQTCQSTLIHEKTNEKVWFNQAHLFHFSTLPSVVRESLSKMFSESQMPRNSYLGTGGVISPADVQAIHAVYDTVKNPIALKKNEVMLLNNILVAHGRHPYQGERKVRVAMTA